MVQEHLRAKVLWKWRKLCPKFQLLKPLLSEARRIEDAERSRRKEIGEAMGDKLSMTIDGKAILSWKKKEIMVWIMKRPGMRQ